METHIQNIVLELNKLIEIRGCTTKWLAKKSGLTYRKLKSILTGSNTKPCIWDLEKLAASLSRRIEPIMWIDWDLFSAETAQNVINRINEDESTKYPISE